MDDLLASTSNYAIGVAKCRTWDLAKGPRFIVVDGKTITVGDRFTVEDREGVYTVTGFGDQEIKVERIDG